NGERFDIVVRLAGVHTQEQLIESVQHAPDVPDPRPEPKQPRPGQPMPGDPHGKTSGEQRRMPPEVAAQFEPRRGYANYYFNRLNRDRVWNAFLAHGDFQPVPTDWKLEGESAMSRVEVHLGETEVFARLPDGPARLDLTADLSVQLVPGGNAHLLMAL